MLALLILLCAFAKRFDEKTNLLGYIPSHRLCLGVIPNQRNELSPAELVKTDMAYVDGVLRFMLPQVPKAKFNGFATNIEGGIIY